MKFIKVKENDIELLVNINHILYIKKDGNRSAIQLISDKFILCDDSYENVVKIIYHPDYILWEKK